MGKQAQISSFNKLNPLPHRMPLFCSIPTSDFIRARARTYPILFRDEQIPLSSQDQDSNNDKNDSINRVAIRQVKAPCNRYGLSIGDVITHMNGEPVVDKTSDDLMTAILLSCSEDDMGFNIVVNADEETAEKLKVRASLLRAMLLNTES